VEGFDLDIYQSMEVEALCSTLMSVSGITYTLDEVFSGVDEGHVQAYKYLREALLLCTSMDKDAADNVLQ